MASSLLVACELALVLSVLEGEGFFMRFHVQKFDVKGRFLHRCRK